MVNRYNTVVVCLLRDDISGSLYGIIIKKAIKIDGFAMVGLFWKAQAKVLPTCLTHASKRSSLSRLWLGKSSANPGN